MGSNEKYEAAMHGGEHDFGSVDTASANRVRFMSESELDRFIAKIRAEALTDLADQMRDRFTASWIRGKARELTHGPRKITGAFAVPESEADCGDND